MADMNIRNIDQRLLNRAKAKGNLEQKKLRTVVIELLERYVADFQGSEDLNGAHCPVSGPLIKNEQVKR